MNKQVELKDRKVIASKHVKLGQKKPERPDLHGCKRYIL
jgi:hypothetical protein